jgi:hypothetical protein
MMAMGRDIFAGLAIGILQGASGVNAAMVGLVGGIAGGTTSANVTFNINGNRDPQTVADIAWTTFARELGLREGV